MPQQTIGLLVMAYGTPTTPDAIDAFYTHIRHGQKPSDALLQDLEDRYRASAACRRWAASRRRRRTRWRQP